MGRENSIFHSLLHDQRKAKQKDKKNEIQRGRLQRVKHQIQAEAHAKTIAHGNLQGLFVVGHQMVGTSTANDETGDNKKKTKQHSASPKGTVILMDSDVLAHTEQDKTNDDEDLVYRSDDLGGVKTPVIYDEDRQDGELSRALPALLLMSKQKLQEALGHLHLQTPLDSELPTQTGMTLELPSTFFDEGLIRKRGFEGLCRYETYKLLILANVWRLSQVSLLSIVRDEITKCCLKLHVEEDGKDDVLDEGERFIKHLREHQMLLRGCDLEKPEDVGSIPDQTIGYMWNGMAAIAALGLFTDSKLFPPTTEVDTMALVEYNVPAFSFLLAIDLYDCLSNIAIATNLRFKHQPLLYECKALRTKCLTLMEDKPFYTSLFVEATTQMEENNISTTKADLLADWIIDHSTEEERKDNTFFELSLSYNRAMLGRFICRETASFGFPLEVLFCGWARVMHVLLNGIRDKDGFRSKNDRDSIIRETLERMTQRTVVTMHLNQDNYRHIQIHLSGRSASRELENKGSRKERTRFRKFTSVATPKESFQPQSTSTIATLLNKTNIKEDINLTSLKSSALSHEMGATMVTCQDRAALQESAILTSSSERKVTVKSSISMTSEEDNGDKGTIEVGLFRKRKRVQ